MIKKNPLLTGKDTLQKSCRTPSATLVLAAPAFATWQGCMQQLAPRNSRRLFSIEKFVTGTACFLYAETVTMKRRSTRNGNA